MAPVKYSVPNQRFPATILRSGTMSDLEDVEPSRVKPADCLPNLNFVSLDGFHPMYVSVRQVKVVPIVDTVDVRSNSLCNTRRSQRSFLSRRGNG